VRNSNVAPRVTATMAAAFCLVACAVTGSTSRETVSLRESAVGTSAPLRAIEVDSIERDPAGIRLINVGSYAWGKFGDGDLANLRGSLEDTLAAASADHPRAEAEAIRLHVLIRQYIVGTSNDEGAVWAGIEWRASAGKDPCLFEETFYATSSRRFWGTVGGEKDIVDRAIVKRIALTALALSSGKLTRPAGVEHTYSTFKAASASMPETLASWGPIFPVPFPGGGSEDFESMVPPLRASAGCEAE